MDTGSVNAALIFFSILFLVLFLVFRELILWYWKINQRADLLTEISSRLAAQESILSDLHQIIKDHLIRFQNDDKKTQEIDEISSSVDATFLNEKETISNQLYQIVYSGKIDKNTSLEIVKKNFSSLYKNKYDSSTIDKKFFSKKPVVIKKGLELDKAKSFIKHFSAKTGGVFQMEKM